MRLDQDTYSKTPPWILDIGIVAVYHQADIVIHSMRVFSCTPILRISKVLTSLGFVMGNVLLKRNVTRDNNDNRRRRRPVQAPRLVWVTKVDFWARLQWTRTQW